MSFSSDPTFAFFAITLTALAYASLSNFLLRRFGNRRRQKEIQAEINRINRAAQEASRKGKAAPHPEGETEHGELLKLVQESLMLQMKPLVGTLAAFFLISAGLRAAFPDFKVVLAFHIPVFIQNLQNFPNWRDTFGVIGWFLIAAIVSGLVIQFVADRFLPDGAEKAKQAK
ncbi:MAG: hypothetical protein PHF51_02020 [Candidatus ainarchaeum sp.]|nr:hypothetical protein [Candidatus ainarchaeum sp.]